MKNTKFLKANLNGVVEISYNEDVYAKRLKLEAQIERISTIIESMKDELFSIYFK